MSSTIPQIVIAKPTKTAPANGVLQVSASTTQAGAHQGATLKPGSQKLPSPRLKVVIRRLPPALTEEELLQSLGLEWTLGGGRVDWMSYKPGKSSQDPARISRPSRVYLHVTDQSHLLGLSEKVRQTTFRDAQGSWSSASLLGPPSVEFAPYGRVPNNKRRNDARQGTIDQDPEFISFLEELTQPIPSRKTIDEEKRAAENKKEEVKVTPLVQFLKDRKAGRVKDVSSPGTRTERKSPETPKLGKNRGDGLGSTRSGGPSGRAVEGGAKDAVKVLGKDVNNSPRKDKTSSPAKGGDVAAESKGRTTPTPAPPKTPTTERRRERGSVSAAARILRRDLGLGGDGGPKGRRDATRTPTSTKDSPASASQTPTKARGTAGNAGTSEQTTETGNTPSPRTPSSTKMSEKPSSPEAASKLVTASNRPTPPSKPAADRIPSKGPATTTTGGPRSDSPASVSGSPASTDSSRSTQAFIKHANPSQGITESVLHAAMETFGAVLKAEIDPRKGFAYVDFAEHEALQKAIRASPVSIAQGQVVVLERRDRPGAASNRGRGGGGGRAERGGGGGRGRGGVSSFASPRGGSGGGGRGRTRGSPAPRGGGGGAAARDIAGVGVASSDGKGSSSNNNNTPDPSSNQVSTPSRPAGEET
ncbi:MAG: N-acetylglucosaminyltransferase [Watsoniomyces obsoletus]|nr:MAG: N-acetylglucosaminyltransferase [Watsoniomyces obsoletus]